MAAMKCELENSLKENKHLHQQLDAYLILNSGKVCGVKNEGSAMYYTVLCVNMQVV